MSSFDLITISVNKDSIVLSVNEPGLKTFVATDKEKYEKAFASLKHASVRIYERHDEEQVYAARVDTSAPRFFTIDPELLFDCFSFWARNMPVITLDDAAFCDIEQAIKDGCYEYLRRNSLYNEVQALLRSTDTLSNPEVVDVIKHLFLEKAASNQQTFSDVDMKLGWLKAHLAGRNTSLFVRGEDAANAELAQASLDNKQYEVTLEDGDPTAPPHPMKGKECIFVTNWRQNTHGNPMPDYTCKDTGMPAWCAFCSAQSRAERESQEVS